MVRAVLKKVLSTGAKITSLSGRMGDANFDEITAGSIRNTPAIIIRERLGFGKRIQVFGDMIEVNGKKTFDPEIEHRSSRLWRSK